MPRKLFTVDDPFVPGCSEIIDVRSPLEYFDDHVPGAKNFPVLSNDERREVGTVYKQVGAFKGRKLGAGLIAANIGEMLRSYFSAREETYRPLIYCARGGQRSKSLGVILSEVGWEVCVLNGGYKRYRSVIRDAVASVPLRFEYRVLTGLTGSGKSRILEHLETAGAQVLHLERLAAHQGSLLGADRAREQPSQKMFESELMHVLRSFSTDRPVWVESESQKIGKIFLPPGLHTKMRNSPHVSIEAALTERVRFTIEQYGHFISNPGLLKPLLNELRRLHSGETIDRWLAYTDAGRWEELVSELLTAHYDPRYTKALLRNYGIPIGRFKIENLREESIRDAARALLHEHGGESEQNSHARDVSRGS